MAKVEEKKTLDRKLSGFIQANRKVILIVCAVVLAVVVIIGITTAVSKSSQKKWMAAVETAEENYTAWTALADDDAELGTKADEVAAELETIVSGTKNSYPNMKASYLLGLLSYAQEEYTAAAEYFNTVRTDYSEGYLASTALMNEAVSLEMSGDSEAALDRYQTLVDTFADSSAEASHALFSIGRIYETNGDTDLAVAVFEQLLTDYPSSEWSKLAQVRLIALD